MIVSPIQNHIPQCLESLKAGMSVLCEKPLTGAVQDGLRLTEVLREKPHWVEIGYQWSFSQPIQNLKRDIESGLWGEPVRMKSLCLWPRRESYYRRNDWAGKIQDSEGQWILDSPANNAMAHFLHNMLYLLGETPSASAVPGLLKRKPAVFSLLKIMIPSPAVFKRTKAVNFFFMHPMPCWRMSALFLNWSVQWVRSFIMGPDPP